MLQSGGALGGIIAQGFASLFTALGATIVFVIAGVFIGLAAFNRSIADVAEWVFNRPDYEPEPVRRERRPPRETRERYEQPASASRTGTRSALDIPVEATGLPRVEVTGRHEVRMENHKGILAYGREEIIVSGGKLLIKVKGDGLELKAMNGDELLITGTVTAVELE